MRKQLFISAGMSAILALGIAQSAYATPTTIIDSYVGGDAHGRGDVIGSEDWFGVDSMDVELLTGNWLSVTIKTNFAGRDDDGLFDGSTQSNLTDGLGIGYGDLFLSNSWTPNDDESGYASDNYLTGTAWSHAFSLDDRWANGGTGTLYSLTGDDSDTLLSQDFLTGGTYRNGQEIAVDTSTKGETATFNSGSWGMTCGNDTIEGEYSVPEPAMLGLLALGLIGIGVSQRKRS